MKFLNEGLIVTIYGTYHGLYSDSRNKELLAEKGDRTTKNSTKRTSTVFNISLKDSRSCEQWSTLVLSLKKWIF